MDEDDSTSTGITDNQARTRRFADALLLPAQSQLIPRLSTLFLNVNFTAESLVAAKLFLRGVDDGGDR